MGDGWRISGRYLVSCLGGGEWNHRCLGAGCRTRLTQRTLATLKLSVSPNQVDHASRGIAAKVVSDLRQMLGPKLLGARGISAADET
jgi:hypothetical protein